MQAQLENAQAHNKCLRASVCGDIHRQTLHNDGSRAAAPSAICQLSRKSILGLTRMVPLCQGTPFTRNVSVSATGKTPRQQPFTRAVPNPKSSQALLRGDTPTEAHNKATNRQPLAARDKSTELRCQHFHACDGCSLATSIDKPPLYHEASAFFTERGLQDFTSVLNAVHGWRCRAKLAVRGSPGRPQVGLFKEGSHDVVSIPSCSIHHPRINEAADLITQLVAQTRVAPFSEGSSTGVLRYLQLTAVSPTGQAETDPWAQVQAVLVVNLPTDTSTYTPQQAAAKAALSQLCSALWALAGGPAGQRATANISSQSSSTSSSGGGLRRDRFKGNRTSVPVSASASASTSVPYIKGSNTPVGSASSQQVVNARQMGSTPRASPSPLLHSIWLNYHPHAQAPASESSIATPVISSAPEQSSSSAASTSQLGQLGQLGPQEADADMSGGYGGSANAVLGRGWQLLGGPAELWQSFGGAHVCLSPGSFVQANYGAMQRVIDDISTVVLSSSNRSSSSPPAELQSSVPAATAAAAAAAAVARVAIVAAGALPSAGLAAAGPSGAARKLRLTELHAGVGTISLALAARSAGMDSLSGTATSSSRTAGYSSIGQTIVGCTQHIGSIRLVEVNPAAAQPFARAHKRLLATAEAAGRTAELPDMQYITALAGLDPSSHLFGADIVIVDPPRKGLEASVLQALCSQSEQEQDGTDVAAPHTLVYLSCGFPALKRDCDTLLAGGWRLASAKAFIFFPGTDAIETLAIFTR